MGGHWDSMSFLLAAIVGYLCGSVPFGLLLTKAAGLGDIRLMGSGNIGATNVLRTGRKGLAAATLLLDALKGFAAVWLVRWLLGPEDLAAGVMAAIGHMYPVWLGFRGGKGGATGLGVGYAAMPLVALLCTVTWAATLYLSRISSVSTLTAFALAPVFTLAFSTGEHALMALLMGVLVFWKHEANIRRLMAGTEPKVGQK